MCYYKDYIEAKKRARRIDYSYIGASTSSSSGLLNKDWILYTGFWNDDGKWIDGSSWNDG